MPYLRSSQTTNTTRVRSLIAATILVASTVSTIPHTVKANPPAISLAPGSPIRCSVASTTLFSGPSTVAQRIAAIQQGRTAKVVARSGEWIRIRLASGTLGWVPAEHAKLDTAAILPRSRFVRGTTLRPTTAKRTSQPAVAVVKADAPSGTDDDRGDSIVRTALTYRGTPYRFGATGRGAFDCSGFTKFLFSTEGTQIPRTASEQYRSAPAVPRDQLQSGDLVFFKNTYKRGISHVGVYIGNGKFIHAASGSRGVVVDSLDSAYYQKKWAGARRPQ